MSRREVTRDDEIGTRLLATSEAMLAGVAHIGARATLVGFGRNPDLIRVVVDGNKTRQTYHRKFWRRAQTFAEKARVF